MFIQHQSTGQQSQIQVQEPLQNAGVPLAQQHLVLRLTSAQLEVAPLSQATMIEDKVIALVNDLIESPLFEKQQLFLHKWNVEVLPLLKQVDTKDQKLLAAQCLALLFIEVIKPARLHAQNRNKQREVNAYNKALETLLQPLLTGGTEPKAFIAKAELADRKTRMLVGSMAIVNNTCKEKSDLLQSAEKAHNQELLAHHAEMRTHYLKLSTSAWEEMQKQKEDLQASLQEVHVIQQNLMELHAQAKEASDKLQAQDTSLKAALGNCEQILNQRITR